MRPKNGSSHENARKEMTELFGFVPEFYQAIPQAISADTWEIQRDLELADTALDHKTKELIGLAVAAHIKCPYCIHFHTEGARAFGASPEELREAAAMGGMTVMFSNTLTGGQVNVARFREETNRAMKNMMSKSSGSSAKSGKSASKR